MLAWQLGKNTLNLLEMRNSVIATSHHCTAFASDATRHLFCTQGKSSWCKWQSDKVVKLKTYKSKFTRSNNEQIKTKKNIFVSEKVVEIAVNSAVIAHNERILGFTEVFKLLDFLPGYYFNLSA